MTALPGQPIPPCPHPAGCPVAVDRVRDLASTSGAFRLVSVPVRPWHRVYSAHDTFETPNPGVGNSRFAPFPDPVTDMQVPTMYLAGSLGAALLETVFHNVDPTTDATVVGHRDLHGRLHAQVSPPRDLLLIDLRDEELARLALDRRQLATSPAEHYPCTRSVAQILYAIDTSIDGIVWHSRQAEPHGFEQVEATVVFCNRVASARRSWILGPSANALGALLEGAGLTAVNELAARMGLTLSGEEF